MTNNLSSSLIRIMPLLKHSLKKNGQFFFRLSLQIIPVVLFGGIVFSILVEGYSFSSNNILPSRKDSGGRFYFDKKDISNTASFNNNLHLNNSAYPFRIILNNITWNRKNLTVDIKGVVKQMSSFLIIEINPGVISAAGMDKETVSSYAVDRDNVITVSYLRTKWGVLNGTINLSGQAPKINLHLDIKGISLKDVNRFWGIKNFPFQGSFRGRIDISGTLKNILISGKMEAYHGMLENYRFDKVFLNFKGVYPWISFTNSYSMIGSIPLSITGSFNIADIYGLPYSNFRLPGRDDYRLNFSSLFSNEKKSDMRSFFTLSNKADTFRYRIGNDSFLNLEVKNAPSSDLMGRKFEF